MNYELQCNSRIYHRVLLQYNNSITYLFCLFLEFGVSTRGSVGNHLNEHPHQNDHTHSYQQHRPPMLLSTNQNIAYNKEVTEA